MISLRSTPASIFSRLRTFLLAAGACLFLLCAGNGRFSPGVVHGAPPQSFVMSSMALRVDAGVLLLGVALSVDDEDGLRDLLKDGAVLEFSITIDMQRKRSWWMNADVVHLVYTSALRHDPLTREFRLTMPRKGGDVTVKDRNLTRLLHNTWRAFSLPIVALRELLPANDGEQKEYDVHVSLKLRHIEVPPWLEKSTMFWSSNVIPEKNDILEFSY
jgi:hypothetical protein